MLKVWGRTNSVNVQKVMWCIAELGIEYERHDAGLQFGVNDEAWFLQRNPNGLIPLIQDGDYTLWESNAIVRYLCAKHATAGLYPESAQQRGEADRWMDWQLSTLARPQGIAFWGLVRTAEADRDMAAIERAIAETNRILLVLDRHLEQRRFVAGNDFTMGDIPVGAITHRWLAIKDIDRPQWPALRRWFDRLTERAPFRDHVMLPLS